jgi:hypothetical protein
LPEEFKQALAEAEPPAGGENVDKMHKRILRGGSRFKQFVQTQINLIRRQKGLSGTCPASARNMCRSDAE